MAFEFKIGKFLNAEGLGGALDNMGQAVLRAADVHAGVLKGAMISGGHGNRGGEQWAPWSPRYAAKVAKMKRSEHRGFLLYKTGALRKSIGSRVINLSGPEYKVGVGSEVWYASTHQHGSPAQHIPARPIAVMTASDQTSFDKRVVAWADEKVNGDLHGGGNGA